MVKQKSSHPWKQALSAKKAQEDREVKKELDLLPVHLLQSTSSYRAAPARVKYKPF